MDIEIPLADEATEPIDLLVTDVAMPGMDGLELTHRLRERDPSLRVLITSGYANLPDGSRRELPKSALFLQKPFGPRDLALKLAEIYN